MKSSTKNKIEDFKLLSPQTKKRVSGLIEMKLTPKTILLFAQEYESYDPEVRLEIVEFIGFLMGKELDIFINQIKDQQTNFEEIKTRQIEFEEKAKNIKEIQNVLVKPLTDIKKTEKKEKNKTDVKTSEIKKESSNKISQLLKEAEERERKNAALDKKMREEAEKRAKLEAEKAKKAALEKTAKKEKVTKEKVVKEKVTKEAKVKVKKDDNAEFLRRQKELQLERERNEKDYARREAEKEKLWLELYGKSREESLKNRDSAKVNATNKTDEERDKTPQMSDWNITSYNLFGSVYPIEEIVDPKNKMYLFWFTTKQKVGIGNLFSYIEMLVPSKQKKLFKKRLKWEKRVAKISKNNNASTNANTVKKENENNTEK